MTREAESGLLAAIILLSYIAAFISACVWGGPHPPAGTGFVALDASRSGLGALPACVLIVSLAVPYLLWRTRVWGIAASMMAFVAAIVLSVWSIVPAAGEASGSVEVNQLLVLKQPGGIDGQTALIVLIASSAVGLLVGLRFFWILRAERSAWLRVEAEDGVDLSDELKHQFEEMSQRFGERYPWFRQSAFAYLWAVLAIVAVILTLSFVSDTNARRERSVLTSATVEIVERHYDDGSPYTEAQPKVADFPDAECGEVTGDLAQVGLVLRVLVDPSDVSCELVDRPQQPLAAAGAVALFVLLAVAEVLRRRVRHEQIGSLGQATKAVPVWVVNPDGQLQRIRLQAFTGRVFVDTGSFVELEPEGDLDRDGATRTVRGLPMWENSADGKQHRFSDAELASQLALSVVHCEIPEREGQHSQDSVSSVPQAASEPTGSHTHAPESIASDTTIPDASLEARHVRATGGPYYLVPQLLRADKLLLVDPASHTVLVARLFGGQVGEKLGRFDPLDFLLALWTWS